MTEHLLCARLYAKFLPHHSKVKRCIAYKMKSKFFKDSLVHPHPPSHHTLLAGSLITHMPGSSSHSKLFVILPGPPGSLCPSPHSPLSLECPSHLAYLIGWNSWYRAQRTGGCPAFLGSPDPSPLLVSVLPVLGFLECPAGDEGFILKVCSLQRGWTTLSTLPQASLWWNTAQPRPTFFPLSCLTVIPRPQDAALQGPTQAESPSSCITQGTRAAQSSQLRMVPGLKAGSSGGSAEILGG